MYIHTPSIKTNHTVNTNDGCRSVVYRQGGMARMEMNNIVTGRKRIIGNNNAIYPRSIQDDMLHDVWNEEAEKIVQSQALSLERDLCIQLSHKIPVLLKCSKREGERQKVSETYKLQSDYLVTIGENDELKSLFYM